MSQKSKTMKQLVESIIFAFPRPFRSRDVETVLKHLTEEPISKATVQKYVHEITQMNGLQKVPFCETDTRDSFYCWPIQYKEFSFDCLSQFPLQRDDKTMGSWGKQYIVFIELRDLIQIAGAAKYMVQNGDSAAINELYNNYDEIAPGETTISPLSFVRQISLHAFEDEFAHWFHDGKFNAMAWEHGQAPPFQIVHGWDLIEEMTKKYVLACCREEYFQSYPVPLLLAFTQRDETALGNLHESFKLLQEEFEGSRGIMNTLLEQSVAVLTRIKARGTELGERLKSLSEEEMFLKKQISYASKRLREISNVRKELLLGDDLADKR